MSIRSDWWAQTKLTGKNMKIIPFVYKWKMATLKSIILFLKFHFNLHVQTKLSLQDPRRSQDFLPLLPSVSVSVSLKKLRKERRKKISLVSSFFCDKVFPLLDLVGVSVGGLISSFLKWNRQFLLPSDLYGLLPRYLCSWAFSLSPFLQSLVLWICDVHRVSVLSRGFLLLCHS